MNTKNQTNTESVLTTLRDLVPKRRLSYNESLRLAELQANRLLELTGIRGPLVPSELVTELPRIEIRYQSEMPVSGSAHWEAGRWVITLNASEAAVRRRFSLMHEFKHVLDHTTKQFLYGDTSHDSAAAQRAERVADHFAACLLMPKRWLKSVWFGSSQNSTLVATRLQVSARALSVRLWYLGLGVETERCPRTSQIERHSDRRAAYFRSTPFTGAPA